MLDLKQLAWKLSVASMGVECSHLHGIHPRNLHESLCMPINIGRDTAPSDPGSYAYENYLL